MNEIQTNELIKVIKDNKPNPTHDYGMWLLIIIFMLGLIFYRLASISQSLKVISGEATLSKNSRGIELYYSDSDTGWVKPMKDRRWWRD